MRTIFPRSFPIVFSLLLSIVFLGTFGLSKAQAQTSRIYFAGYLGVTRFDSQPFSAGTTSGQIEMNNATSFAGALGLRLSRNVRLEGELSYRKSDMDYISHTGGTDSELGGELRSYFGMVNVYYDFALPGRWRMEPYVSAGLGYGFHSGEFADASGQLAPISADTQNMAWQLGTGFRYRVNRDTAFSLGYRYLGSPDLDFNSMNMEYDSHEFRIGIEYDLPVAASR